MRQMLRVGGRPWWVGPGGWAPVGETRQELRTTMPRQLCAIFHGGRGGAGPKLTGPELTGNDGGNTQNSAAGWQWGLGRTRRQTARAQVASLRRPHSGGHFSSMS